MKPSFAPHLIACRGGLGRTLLRTPHRKPRRPRGWGGEPSLFIGIVGSRNSGSFRVDQTGYAYTEDLSSKSVMAAAGTAAVVADGVARLGPKIKAFKAGLTDMLSSAIGVISVSNRDAHPSTRERTCISARQSDYEVRVGFADSSGAVLVVDSDGRMSFDRQPMTRISVGCTADQGGQREW